MPSNQWGPYSAASSTAVMAMAVYLGEKVPNTLSSSPSLTANSGITNTPPATGGITVPQSPSGAVVTNTGRTLSATQSYMAASLNAQNVPYSPPIT